jgi:3-oxoacyl-[acyl-carrier protein] reductase
MDKLLAKKTAIVTGATRGIGKGIAEKFAKEGCSLALFGTNAELGRQVVDELKALSDKEQKILFYQVDVGDFGAVEKAIGEIVEHFGAVDILVNNAGITRDNLLMKMSEEDWDRVLTTNLKSVYNTCKACIRAMMRARSGKIINISSISGLMGNAGQTNYAASKAGMVGFTKALAKEVASRNIHVNCVAPGFIKTAMTDVIPEEKRAAFADTIPLKRFGETEDIANATLFLASPLSDYITGQVLTVDGGLLM